MRTHLNRTEDPQNQGLYSRQSCSAYAEHEIDANVLSNFGVSASLGISIRPVLQPDASGYVVMLAILLAIFKKTGVGFLTPCPLPIILEE